MSSDTLEQPIIAASLFSSAEGKTRFRGFHPPTSNTTYTPNQFFDVVLRDARSTGIVRAAAFILRKTLGWCDSKGNPQELQIQVSYKELEGSAGINSALIRKALDEAVENKYLTCLRMGRADTRGAKGTSALFELRWDDSPGYRTKSSEFEGFFSGEGNRTYIPNQFFDELIPHENLAVIKVVGTIIRHTIGFQNRYGFRRQEVALSFTDIQRKAGISSRRTLNDALSHAIQCGYIVKVKDGAFIAGDRAACTPNSYSIKWLDSNVDETTLKRIPKDHLKKDTEPTRSRHLKKDTGGTLKRIPKDHLKKDTLIEIKPENNTFEITQQQPDVAEPLILNLIEEGFNRKTAEQLARQHSPELIRQQIDWLPQRRVQKNRLGMLRRAIEENWPEPNTAATVVLPADIHTAGQLFAAYFYAGYSGNPAQPTAEPSINDVNVAERYAQRLVALWSDDSQAATWGREFGEFVREQQRHVERPIVSLVLALRSYSDAYFQRHQVRYDELLLERRHQQESEHYDQHFPRWLEYVQTMEDQIKNNRYEDYSAFEEHRTEERESIESGRWVIDREKRLEQFDSRQKRLEDFQLFFQEEVLDFWDWDTQSNSTMLELTTKP